MLLKWFTFIIGVLIAVNTYGQGSPYRNFTTNDGLINNRCGNVVQDSMGYIWVTTDNGICNYDGRKFNFFKGNRKQYYFAHNNSITTYKGACIMGATDQGVAKAMGNTLEFIYPKNDTPRHFMCSLQINDSSYLTANVAGYNIQLVTKNKVQIIALPPRYRVPEMYIFLIFQDVFKNIWIGTNNGFVVYNKGDMTKPVVLPFFKNKYINVLKQDVNNNLLISSDRAMYYIPAASLSNIQTIAPIQFAKQEHEITAVGTFANGDIAISNYPDGLLLYNKALKQIKKLEKPLLPDVVFWDIFVDREENLWLATENGLYRYSNLSIKNYVLTMPKGAPQVKSGVGFNETFLFSNSINLYGLANEKISTVTTKNIIFRNQELGTSYNTLLLNDYDPFVAIQNKYTKQCTYANNVITVQKNIVLGSHNEELLNLENIITLPNGIACMLTKQGNLVSLTNGIVAPIEVPTTLTNITYATISAGSMPNEAILFSNYNGLYYINFLITNNKITVTLKQYLPIKELTNTYCVNAVIDINNAIWLATGNKGLLYFTKKNNTYSLQKQYTEPEISSTLITCITKDSDGNIWLGSNKGIDKIECSKGSYYTVYKGLYKNNTLGNYIYLLKEYKGLLHIGSSGGLSTVPINNTIIKILPNVYISKISCNSNMLNVDSLATKGVFQYFENNFNFEFTSPTFINETQTEYQYKLDGVDADWSMPSNNYTVNYNQLPPGNYTFRVRAKNANGLWSVTDATFSITIKKPFYKHWLFYILCTIAIASILYWLYRQKINKIIAIEKTRSSISKDLHDDVGTTISNLTLMNVVLQNKIENKPNEAKELAKKMEVISRGMVQSMSDIVWSANPDNDSLEQLVDRLRLFCSNVFEDLGITYELKLIIKNSQQKLPMQWRKDIYLIGKEIISNCAKYSKATKFLLTIHATKNTLTIAANDNGIGFNEATINKGNGLKNIRNRVQQLKGAVILHNTIGTQWTINLPL